MERDLKTHGFNWVDRMWRCVRRPSRCFEILMLRFPADGPEIEAKISRKGSERRFSRKLRAKQIRRKFVVKRRRTGGEAGEDKLLCVICGAAGLRLIYLYCSTPPKMQSKLLPQCQNSLLWPVFSAESLFYMQIYKRIGASGLAECQFECSYVILEEMMPGWMRRSRRCGSQKTSVREVSLLASCCSTILRPTAGTNRRPNGWTSLECLFLACSSWIK